MDELTANEKLIRDTGYVSEAPEGGILEIKHNGKTIVKREGEKEIERIKE